MWKPIDSAPDDGSRFLAFEVCGPMDELDEEGRILTRDSFEKSCVVAYYCFGSIITYPWNGEFVKNRKFTHWMPLPIHPKD